MKKRHQISFATNLLLTLALSTGRATTAHAATVEDTTEVSKAHALLEAVAATDRFINKLDSTYTIDLPVGITANDQQDAEKYAIIISEIKVRDGQTYLTAYMAFTVPGTTKKIAFKGTDIPFSFSGGIQGEATLELVSDFDVQLANHIGLILKGNGLTAVTFDCDGFKAMDITAQVVLDSTLFVPEDEDGSLQNTALTATVQTTVTSWDDLMIGVSFDPFQLKGLTGVGFNITHAVLDFSDSQNPTGITFGSNYAEVFPDGTLETWQGLYIQDTQAGAVHQGG